MANCTGTVEAQNFCFTGGRWLSRDQEERSARYLRFNFDALRQEVVEASQGATSITSFERIDRPSTRIFIFQMNNGKKVVAKMPFKLGSPSDLVVRSEVATIKFLQMETNFPTPKILSCNSDPENSVGTPYILTEHASGVQLSKIWNSMSMGQKIKLIESIHQKIKTMVDLEFPAYGSIYESEFASQAGFNVVPINKDFVVGPDCSPIYWDGAIGCERFYHQVNPNRGPWEGFEAYCNGRIDASVSGIPSENSPYLTAVPRSSWHGSPIQAKRALDQTRKIVKTIADDAKSQAIIEACKPILMFYLPKRHVFVSESDPTVVTDFIGLQHVSVEASFMHTQSFITFLEPQLPPSPEDDQLTQVWIQNTVQHAPQLLATMALPQALFRPIATCDQTWEIGSVNQIWAIEELRREWSRIGLESPFPVPELGEAEKKQLSDSYTKQEGALMMRVSLAREIACRLDGFVLSEDFQTTLSIVLMMWVRLKDSFTEMPIRDDVWISAEDARLMWPWDIPFQFGEDLVMISPRSMTTAIPKLFSNDPQPKPAEDKGNMKQAKEKEKRERKPKDESKGGLFKSFKRHFA